MSPEWAEELPLMSPLALVVSIVLVDLLGFSLVMPLLAPFAKDYGFSPLQIGLLIAGYPMAQLFAGPILGRLSDRYGRRPVLAASQFGTAVSFLILGFSTNFTVMFLARLLDGASGGNILVAQAYVADVTKPEERSRGYGLIGMAFGLGFVLGPLLGLALVELPVPAEWRLRVPFLVAALFSTIAWILVLLRLPESLPKDSKARQAARVVSLRGLADVFQLPAVGRMIGLATLIALGFAALEATFSLYLEERQPWGPAGVMAGFTFVGLVTAVVQGGLVRRLVPRYGEPRLILVGLVLLILGFAGLALARGTPAVLLATALICVGQGFVSPTVTGVLSQITPEGERGAVFGTLSSAQTLARMANYLVANLLFGHGNTAAPFWEAAAIALAALGLAFVTLPTVRKLARTSPTDKDLGELIPSGAVDV
jgi:MFS transporter, DHA1 family, tetracycline resistance protein